MIPTLYEPFRKWSEKGSVWLASDTHFEDVDRDAMGYSISDDEQIEIILKRVGRNDCFVHLGDVGNPERLKRLKSRKILIMGNHDQGRKNFERYFDEIYSGPLFVADRILLSHEPIFGIDFAFNFHGHDHAPENLGDRTHMNLAANVRGYEPVNLGKLIKEGVLSGIPSVHRLTIDLATERKRERLENESEE